MRNPLLLTIFLILVITGSGFGQLTGIKNIPGDFPTIASAISNLNSSGVGTGGVQFNVAAGYTETFTTGTDGLITTTTSDVSKPILFVKSGTGTNPVITAFTGAGTMDAIITLYGGDYITFNGIDLAENAANTNATACMEYGYAILNPSNSDASQHCEIKNCNISLNIAVNSTGIYTGCHNNSSTTELSPSSEAATHSFNKFNGNTINCYNGIVLKGSNSPAALNPPLYDIGCEIGTSAGNNITHIGGQSYMCYGILTFYQDNLKVANNTITSTMAGSSSAYGISLSTARNGSYEMYNNMISLQFSGSGGAANLYAVYNDMGTVGSTNTVNIYNNTVTGCTYPTFTSAQVRLFYVSNMGVNTNIHDNIITNNTVGSSTATATGNFYGLICTKSTNIYGPTSIYNNVITGNKRVQSVSGGGITQYLSYSGASTEIGVYNNTIMNNEISSTGTATLLGISMSVGNTKVFDNTIKNILKANGTTYGISYSCSSSGSTGEIYRNKIDNIEGNAATSSLHGIYNSTGGAISNRAYIFNNMIGDLRALAGSGTTGLVVTGLYMSGATYAGIFNNTIYLDGSSSAANFSSSGIYAPASAVLELNNNIVVNTYTPNGTGIVAALRYVGTLSANYVPTSNNNLYYVGTPSAYRLLFYNGTLGDQNLADFNSRVWPREQQSISEAPAFVNSLAGNLDLHIITGTVTGCESGGIVLGSWDISKDFDQNSRFPNSGYPTGPFTPIAPDMGADEFAGAGIDITPPKIQFTALGPANNANTRTITATITDAYGTPVAGNALPVLYWKINSGAYQAVQATYLTGSTYSFSFGQGISQGDVVSYYIIAQDNALTPNVTANPLPGASTFSSSPPAAGTPPTTPYTYTYVASFSGVYHVGIGKDYTTLTAAAADINTRTLTGPVTLILDDASYPSETFPIQFEANAGSSSANTLTIKPDSGINPLIAGDFTGGIIVFNGIDYVTIDGSNNGSTSRNLTIYNTKNALSGFWAVGITANASGDVSTNITIKNSIIKCIPVHASSSNVTGIRFYGSYGGFNNCIIDNNWINGSFHGIYIAGLSNALTKDCIIRNNKIGSEIQAEAVTQHGVESVFTDNLLIVNNDIMGPVEGSYNTSQCGVFVNYGCTSTKIRQNKIHSMWRPSDDGWGAFGIWYASEAISVTEISNNIIYDIHSAGSAPGVAQSNTYGIFLRTGGNVKIIHNTINLTGQYLSTTWDASSACIGLYQPITGGVEIRNNILKNSQTFLGSTSIDGHPYAIISSAPIEAFSVLDNNDYFADGYSGHVAMIFITGFDYLGVYQTLDEWKAATGKDVSSVNSDPLFVSNVNLLPQSPVLNNLGFYYPTIPQDITGKLRTNPSDIGAYEFGNDPFTNTNTSNSISYNSATITGLANAANQTLTLTFDWGLTSNYGNTIASSPVSINGNSTTSVQASLTGLQPLTMYHYRIRGIAGSGLICYGADSLFITKPSPPTVITTAATSITSSGATGNGTVNANGGNASIILQYGLTTSYGSTVSITPATTSGFTTTPVAGTISGLTPYTTYHYRIAATNEGGTTYGNDMTFTTLPVPSTVITTLASNLIGSTATLNGTVNANYAPTNVSFEWGLTTGYGNTASATPGSVSGSTTTSISADITGLAYATTYHFRAVGNGPGGIVYGNDMSFISDCPLPAAPSVINGQSSVCKNATDVTYSVNTVSGATSYNWTVPSGAIITSGNGTNSIVVNFNNTAISGNVTTSVTTNCGTGPEAVKVITVNELPVPVINGSNSACFNSTDNAYSTLAGMSNYSWSITGGTITNGSGTNNVSVTWTNSGNQNISVNYTDLNGCTNNNATQYSVTVHELPVPAITGETVACESTSYIDYATQPGMSNYTWALSANSGTITENNGATVTVLWTQPGTNFISVNYNDANGCRAANPTEYNVLVNPLPGTPGVISGPTSVCAGASGITYSVAAIPNTTYYFWTLPAGTSIASGTGTNTIIVNFSNDASAGNIQVQGQNDCGGGAFSQPLAISINAIPSEAGNINGETSVCQGTTSVTYSAEPVEGATSYLWTLPAGASIVSGANTNNIIISYGYSAVSGNITVQGVNSCGNGTASSLAIDVNTAPETPVITIENNLLTSSAAEGNQWYLDGNVIQGAVNPTYEVNQNGHYTVIVTLNGCSSLPSNEINVINISNNILSKAQVTVYPNPNNGCFWIELNTENNDLFDVSLISSNGSTIKTMKNVKLSEGNKVFFEQNGLASGIYSLILRSDNEMIVKTIEIVN